MLTINGNLGGLNSFVLVDFGSSDGFLFRGSEENHGLPRRSCDKEFVLEVALANERIQGVDYMPSKLQLNLDKFGCKVQLQITELGA